MKLNIPRGIIYNHLGEDFKSLILSCFERLENNKIVEEFEASFAEYIGRDYSVAFPYARVAIYYALKNQNFPPGSEILMPAITIKGILDVVLDLKLCPVFVDIDPNTLCLDALGIEKATTPKTKAILITYLFGIVPDVDNLVDECKKNNLFVIEDFSQCLNGSYKGRKVGSFGAVGVYSSSSIKTLDTYGGGLLVCDDVRLYDRFKDDQASLNSPSRWNLVNKVIINLIRNTATSRFVFHFLVFPMIKLLSILSPNSVMKQTGNRNQKMIDHLPKKWFERYTSFQAELGLRYLKSIHAQDEIRIANVNFLKANIPALCFPKTSSDSKNVYWQFVAFFNDPIYSQRLMQEAGVDSSTTSLELISSLKNYKYQGHTPNADYLHTHGMFIPSFPSLSTQDLNRIIKVVNSIFDRAVD